MKGQVIDLVRNVISGKMRLMKNALLQENVTSHKFVHKVHKVWNKIHSSIYHDSKLVLNLRPFFGCFFMNNAFNDKILKLHSGFSKKVHKVM